MQELQAKAMGVGVVLTVTDQGRGLFDQIDANRDGRLSVRELRTAVNLVADLDRDQDGRVGKDEIPRNYLAALSRGSVNTNVVSGTALVSFANLNVTNVTRGGAARTGPIWFQKMDLNYDGDVSRREFLGTAEQFNQIDADGDSLIGKEESERFDLAHRKP
jgi:hypothetical protein